jgi:hypothetical protein
MIAEPMKQLGWERLKGEGRGPSRVGEEDKSGTHPPQHHLPLAHFPLVFVIFIKLCPPPHVST